MRNDIRHAPAMVGGALVEMRAMCLPDLSPRMRAETASASHQRDKERSTGLLRDGVPAASSRSHADMSNRQAADIAEKIRATGL